MECSNVAGLLSEQEVCLSSAAGKALRELDDVSHMSVLAVRLSGYLSTLPLHRKVA